MKTITINNIQIEIVDYLLKEFETDIVCGKQFFQFFLTITFDIKVIKTLCEILISRNTYNIDLGFTKESFFVEINEFQRIIKEFSQIDKLQCQTFSVNFYSCYWHLCEFEEREERNNGKRKSD